MGFIEYYKKHSKHCAFFSLELLPEDVKNDLIKLLNNCDRRIGFYVTHSFEINSNKEPINTKMNISYYVRTWHPSFFYSDWFGHMIPVGIRFWRMKKVAGGY